MQISKKLYTTLIIAILTISMIITAVPMVSAEIVTQPFLVAVGGTAPLTTGAVGTRVDVVGNTTSGAASPFSTVTVYLDSLSGIVLGTGSANVDGAYRITVTIPPAVAGVHYIVVNDGETESEGQAFTVTPQITTDVALALPGDSVVVTGHGYAASESVTLTLNSTTLTTPYSTVLTVVPTTNGTGSFQVTFTVPVIAFANFDIYNLNGTDESLNMAFTPITIDYYITATPPAGPTGITTTIAGRIAPSKAYSITFNGAPIGSGTTSTTGAFSITYTIPGVLSEATYEIMIVWDLTSNRTTTFQVLPSPVIALGASSGYIGDKIGVTGSGFSASAAVVIYIDITTVANDSSTGFGPTTGPVPGPAGNLPVGSTFVVPNMAPGTYAVHVEDQYGAVSNTVLFTVLATPIFVVETRAMEYVQGDFLSLTSLSTSATDVVLVITDPNGLRFAIDGVSSGSWQMIAGFFQIPYDVTSLTWFPLPNDAPIGVWNFTCWNSGQTVILDTNLFTVAAPATLDDLVQDVADLETTVNDGVTDILDAIADCAGEITDISGDIATIDTELGQVYSLVSALDISALTSDLALISSDLGDLVIAVADLDAKVTAIAGDVATVETTLGTLEGTVTAIEGNTATIETDVGTLQADVTDVKGSVDSTPAWIAVVLSLVAAIAAIFAVITIRQKIAG